MQGMWGPRYKAGYTINRAKQACASFVYANVERQLKNLLQSPVVFANSMPDVNLGQICPSSRKQNKRKRPYCHDGDESYNLRREFLDGERDKNKTAEGYRKKKISLLEKIVQQQIELIEIQRRTTTALEVIATKFHASTQSPSPYSLSPVIKFS
eukprot:XP_019929860.1 PREDICTED: uncharacterized protein LOC105345752 [Crassostrea gigas]